MKLRKDAFYKPEIFHATFRTWHDVAWKIYGQVEIDDELINAGDCLLNAALVANSFFLENQALRRENEKYEALKKDVSQLRADLRKVKDYKEIKEENKQLKEQLAKIASAVNTLNSSTSRC